MAAAARGERREEEERRGEEGGKGLKKKEKRDARQQGYNYEENRTLVPRVTRAGSALFSEVARRAACEPRGTELHAESEL
jgi:hypothetical protein